MKKLYCLLVTAFLALAVFAEDGYKCNPTYKVDKKGKHKTIAVFNGKKWIKK